jgi:hypothetical protein
LEQKVPVGNYYYTMDISLEQIDITIQMQVQKIDLKTFIEGIDYSNSKIL